MSENTQVITESQDESTEATEDVNATEEIAVSVQTIEVSGDQIEIGDVIAPRFPGSWQNSAGATAPADKSGGLVTAHLYHNKDGVWHAVTLTRPDGYERKVTFRSDRLYTVLRDPALAAALPPATESTTVSETVELANVAAEFRTLLAQ